MTLVIKAAAVLVFIAVMVALNYTVRGFSEYLGPQWTFGFLCGGGFVMLMVWLAIRLDKPSLPIDERDETERAQRGRLIDLPRNYWRRRGK